MISFGFPAASTEQIIQLSREQNSFCETGNNEIFISLPVLFRQRFTAFHGLILKLIVSQDKKVILLTPKIEMDMEIPDDKVHGLPEVLSGPFIFFKGVFFNDDKPVFILNPEKLLGNIT